MKNKVEQFDYVRIMRIGEELFTAYNDQERLAENNVAVDINAYPNEGFGRFMANAIMNGRNYRVDLTSEAVNYWREFERSVNITVSKGSTVIEITGCISVTGIIEIGGAVYAEIISGEDIRLTMRIAEMLNGKAGALC